MRRLALSAALTASMVLTACGGAKQGATCSTNGFLCADTTAALECQGGTWVSLPCKGTGGCKREADVVKCDMSADEEGDNCASTAQGRGLCTKDGLGTLECREGKLVKTNTCRSCMVNGDQVVCSP
jgi:hypothetical protein